MTRGLHPPPDTLTEDDVQTLTAVRRDLYYNGFIGAGFGAGVGLVIHTGAQWGRRLGLNNIKFNRNTLMLSILGGGSMGMYIFAMAAGKNDVHKLRPIFQLNTVSPGELDRQDYRSQMNLAGGGRESEDELDVAKMKEIRLARRRSMMDGFRGHGLSDAHGGQWFKENEK